MNHVNLSGRLVKDIEVLSTKAGKLIFKCCLAVKREYGEETDFINIEGFSENAMLLKQQYTKGQTFSVEGEIRQKKWTDKNGVNHYDYIVFALKEW